MQAIIATEMAAKLGDLRAMLAAGNSSDAYDVLLHEIKPKLTGLKIDEHEVPWGNGVFNKSANRYFPLS